VHAMRRRGSGEQEGVTPGVTFGSAIALAPWD
jgi:hypothetical protein